MTYCLWEDISDRHIMLKTNLPLLLNSMTYCLSEDISDIVA